ncbi:hypothetical protein COF64_20725 [Bacillus sp. AFS043905]|uniref:hypothetical protein n=1 Tax=Peribacillus frigoritolerans TaxID=450367 RepID=UPI000BFC8901|nr:hypothetical protein [Peribacillus frigoritolerans]PHD72448.1 hypothetical protein COF64_20725 [Bacillus sp. AFS043905]TWE03297.1 hypothetical protein FB545_0355 [Peribacillus frigoritolerans]
MRKLLWIFSLLVIIMALGGCSSSSKTSGSSKVKAKAVGYQMVQKNGVLSDRKGISEKDDVKKIENITADVKWDKTASVNKDSKEDAVFWFIDQDNKEGQKYKVWFNETGSADVQDGKQVWGVLEGKDGETLSSIFKLYDQK